MVPVLERLWLMLMFVLILTAGYYNVMVGFVGFLLLSMQCIDKCKFYKCA